jgi:hypothetical protein
MFAALHRTAREQFMPGHLLAVATILGLLAFVVDISRDTLVGVAVALVLAEAVTLFQNTPEIDQRYVNAGIGLVVVAGSLVLGYVALSGGSGALRLPPILLVFGILVLIDAATDFYYGREPTTPEPDDDLSSADVMLLTTHAHLVASELEEGPRTAAELATACDLTESRVEQTLEYLVESGVVSPDGDRYVLHEDQTGLGAFVRMIVAGVVDRALRPVRTLR